MCSLILFSLLVVCFAAAPALGTGYGSGDDTYTAKPVAVTPMYRTTDKTVQYQQVPTVKKTDEQICVEDPSMEWNLGICIKYKFDFIRKQQICIKKEYICTAKPLEDNTNKRDISNDLLYALCGISLFIGGILICARRQI